MTRTISVALGSGIVYVSGTVNGVSVIWTLVGDSWQATAGRSEYDVYLVEITAIDAAGNADGLSVTLTYGMLDLITDRTQADVNRALSLAAKGWAKMTDAERVEWLTDLKGFYNASDLNRVGSAVAFLRDLFATHGYFVDVSPKTDWAVADKPTPGQMDTYINNIHAIRDRLPALAGTPPAPGDAQKLTHTEANDIERILLNVYGILDLLSRYWLECGEIYCGEVTE